MPSGLQTFNASGILQFDSEGSHYVVSQIFSGEQMWTKNYSASDSHILVAYSKRAVGSYTHSILGVRKESNGTFTAETQNVGKRSYTADDFLIVFEPMNLVASPATAGNGIGLETYNAAGQLVYSSAYPTVKVRGIYNIPNSEPQYNAFYGTGPNAFGAYSYCFNTGIPTTDRLNYALFFSQNRLGTEYDAPGDTEVDLLAEHYELTIQNGTLWFELYAYEFESIINGLPVWQGGQFNTYGTLQVFVLDITRMRHLL